MMRVFKVGYSVEVMVRCVYVCVCVFLFMCIDENWAHFFQMRIARSNRQKKRYADKEN